MLCDPAVLIVLSHRFLRTSRHVSSPYNVQANAYSLCALKGFRKDEGEFQFLLDADVSHAKRTLANVASCITGAGKQRRLSTVEPAVETDGIRDRHVRLQQEQCVHCNQDLNAIRAAIELLTPKPSPELLVVLEDFKKRCRQYIVLVPVTFVQRGSGTHHKPSLQTCVATDNL